MPEYRERIIDEIFYALGWPRTGPLRRLLGPFFRLPAGRLGRIASRADREVESSGLCGGSRRILSDLSLAAIIRGADKVPAEGPLLLASNHPGALDSIAIMSSVPRRDLKVLLTDAPFPRAFSCARRFFIYVPRGSAGRAAAIRASIAHLQSGGALLMFAHGDVEPDPELSPAAGESFRDWSGSVEVMLRKVPGAWVQSVIVSGVLLPRFVNSPLVKVRGSGPRRQKLAEVLQMSQQIVFPRSVRTSIHLSFADPVKAKDLPGEDIMSSVIADAHRLLHNHAAWVRTVLS